MITASPGRLVLLSRQCRHLFLLAILSAIASPADTNGDPQPRPAWVAELGYRQQEVFPIRIERHGFPEVPVLLNGKAFHLVFDTGNMMGLTLSPEIIHQLDLPEVGTSPHFDAAGNLEGENPVRRVREVVFSGETWRESSAHQEWRENLAGLIGPRFVKGKRFTLDYRNRLMAVSKSPFPEAIGSGEKFPMVVSPHHEGLILIRGFVEGQKVLIELDTGKSRTVVDPQLVELLDLPEVPHGRRIREVRFGSHTFAVRSAKVSSFRGISKRLPEPILLGVGSDFLSGVLFSCDYPGQAVILYHLED